MSEPLIFVVDDDPLLTRNLAAELAEATGYEVETFSSARQILDVLANARAGELPDAALVGIRITGSDGLSVIDQLHRCDPEIFTMLLTSASDADASAAALAAVGPLRHAAKPAAMTELLPKLRAGLEQRRLAVRLREAESALQAREAALAESARQVAQVHAELSTTHSELRTATERLVQAEQLAAVGRVVSGIAYELSRQLALVGYAEAIKTRVAHDPELVEFADIIVNAQKRLAHMVDEIRDFAAADSEAASTGAGARSGGRPSGRIDCEPADVAAVVDEALAILRYDRDVRERALVRSVRARPLAALHRRKFAQVVINLVSNAVLATRPGDTVEVILDCTTSERGQPLAELLVVDHGAGMPPEVLARLGEPFFTTRGERGSGLGVGICMRIVEEHGGTLTFVSEVGRGTTARVRIPRIEVGQGG